MKEKDKEQLQQGIMKQQDQLRNLQAGFQQEIVAAQNAAMKEIFDKVQVIVKKESQDKKYNLVLTNASVIFNDKPIVDITDVVIKNLH